METCHYKEEIYKSGNTKTTKYTIEREEKDTVGSPSLSQTFSISKTLYLKPSLSQTLSISKTLYPKPSLSQKLSISNPLYLKNSLNLKPSIPLSLHFSPNEVLLSLNIYSDYYIIDIEKNSFFHVPCKKFETKRKSLVEVLRKKEKRQHEKLQQSINQSIMTHF